MAFTPRQLTEDERARLAQELDELNAMLPDPADAPHLAEAVRAVLHRYGQTP